MLLNRIRVIAFLAGILSLAAALSWSGGIGASAGEPAGSGREQLHGVLSRRPLAPLLFSAVRRVRFSPNGAFILVQDDAGILVFAREPLSPRLSVTAPRALLARFSTDSQTLIVATPSLNLARYDLDLPSQTTQTPMMVPKGCLAAALSADGKLAACYDPAFRLHILRTATGENIFFGVFGAAPPRGTPIPVPRGTESAFAEPFGYLSAASMKAWIGRRDFGLQMTFSPDGRYLLARDLHGDVIAVDVMARKEITVSSALKNHLAHAWCFFAPDQIFALDPRKKGDSAVFAFPRGDRKMQLPVAGAGAELLSDPRYLRIDLPDGGGPLVFDLESNSLVETLPQGVSDILAGFAATYSTDGEMLLTKLGEKEPLARVSFPMNPLPTLRTAVVSPDLQTLALAGRGTGGVYDVASGKQVAAFPRMNGAWFAGEEKLFVRSRLPDGSFGPVQKFDRKSSKAAHAWSEETPILGALPGNDIHSAGPVLLVDSPAGMLPESGTIGIQLRATSAYELRALAMENGSVRWSRRFIRDVPVPFADPQGDRFLLAWAATTESGRNETARVSNLPGHVKASHLSEHDTVFEVFDVRSGKLLGGAVAQIGAGPENFESAFSVGDFLILVKDDQRIAVFSISTGRQTARLFGSIPSAYAAVNLLAAADGGRLTLFDLKTGAKRDEFLFSDPVAYSHFSADGKRLLVLTAPQMLYVLDVSGATAPSASPAEP